MLERNELVWVAIDNNIIVGAGTTVLLTDGTAEILACGGVRHREWVKQAEAVVSAWARDCGATKLTMRGRRGWARYFAGWDRSQDDDGNWIYEKDLTSGQV